MSKKSKTVLTFREITEPGDVSILAELKKVQERVAKNDKKFLRVILVDPFSRELVIQLWEDTDIYAPLEEFIQNNDLEVGGPIHLVDLYFDGRFVGSTEKSKVDPNPAQHPLFEKYQKLHQYRKYKIIPEDPALLKEIHKLLTTKPLIESIITRLTGEGIEKTDELLWAVSRLVASKTYTGTVHLILGSPQLEIVPSYMNYVLRQLEILLKAFGDDISKESFAPALLLSRLSKDLISLYEYSQMEEKEVE